MIIKRKKARVKNKEPIFSLTKKDFRIDYFRCSGPGGQKINKTNSGVRITHIETGISYECTETRFQQKNREICFKKLCNDKKFKFWLKQKANNLTLIKDQVNQLLNIKNLKVEIKDNKKWSEVSLEWLEEDKMDYNTWKKYTQGEFLDD